MKYQFWLREDAGRYGHLLSISSGEIINSKYNLKVTDGNGQTFVHRSNKVQGKQPFPDLIQRNMNDGPPKTVIGSIVVEFKPTKNGPLSSISVNSFYEKPSKLPAKNTAKKAIKAKADNNNKVNNNFHIEN